MPPWGYSAVTRQALAAGRGPGSEVVSIVVAIMRPLKTRTALHRLPKATTGGQPEQPPGYFFFGTGANTLSSPSACFACGSPAFAAFSNHAFAFAKSFGTPQPWK